MNKNEFKRDTLSNTTFKEVTIIGDGACLYRCLIRFMVDNQRKLNKHSFFYKIFDDPDIKEGGAAENLQFILKDWLYENRNELIDSFMNFDGTIGEFVLFDHEEIPNMEIYRDLYGIFAGDDDFIITDELAQNLEDGRVKQIIPQRWGGMSEIYAFYKIFGVIVNQYVNVSWVKKKMVYCIEDKRYDKKRYKLIQVIGENSELKINLLFNNSEKIYRRHYTYLRCI